jgi:hypothetical protein
MRGETRASGAEPLKADPSYYSTVHSTHRTTGPRLCAKLNRILGIGAITDISIKHHATLQSECCVSSRSSVCLRVGRVTLSVRSCAPLTRLQGRHRLTFMIHLWTGHGTGAVANERLRDHVRDIVTFSYRRDTRLQTLES